MRIFQVLVIVLIFQITLKSQINFPKDYFRSPVGIPLSVSSNFGEIRPNHFHAGLDIWTEVKSGLNYYSIADGYISRVKVSPRGYGNAIYITHPNGYVSVYAHMSKFKDDVAKYIYKLQHEKQQFELDVYPLPHLFPLKKGDYIGKSGNSGRSYGAHLHFELREEDTEKPINPLYVYDFKDTRKPQINGVYMYSFKNDTGSYYKRKLLKNINGRTIKTFGRKGFSMEIHDYLNRNANRFGVYKIELFIDDSLYFASEMTKFSYYEIRYLNSFIDYKERQISNKKVSKCFIEPNNKLSMYKTKGSGLFDFTDGKLHEVKIIGSDIKGNKAIINFKVQSDSTLAEKHKQKQNNSIRINCFIENEVVTDSFKIYFHKNCLYYNIDFDYYTSKNKRSNYSKHYHIYNRYVPIHNKITIAIKPDSIPEKYKEKALIAGISKRGKVFSVGGEWKNGFIETKIKSFGEYFITVDSIKPNIIPLSINKSGTCKSDIIKFKITDNLSGIEEFIGYVDNRWVLYEYDEKNNLIECDFKKEGVKKGKHQLVLWVKDYSGNISTYKKEVIY